MPTKEKSFLGEPHWRIIRRGDNDKEKVETMTSLDNLKKLEERLRTLLSERERLKARLTELETATGQGGEGAAEELQRTNDLLTQERDGVRQEVESILSAISRMSKAS